MSSAGLTLTGCSAAWRSGGPDAPWNRPAPSPRW